MSSYVPPHLRSSSSSLQQTRPVSRNTITETLETSSAFNATTRRTYSSSSNHPSSSSRDLPPIEPVFEQWKPSERVFRLKPEQMCYLIKRDIADLQQEDKSFVQHLGSLTSMWNELDVYIPHTTEASILVKRAEEDKIFQLLASLSSNYEDLKSHILMNAELPSFNSVCATIQREEVRKKVMNTENKTSLSEIRAYVSNHKKGEERTYKGKRTDLKCSYCESVGHVKDRCWVLHPGQKPKFSKEGKIIQKGWNTSSHKANLANAYSTGSMMNFTSNPTVLMNEFAAYLNKRQIHGKTEEPTITGNDSHTALLGKFAGFLAETDCVPHEEASGILKSFSTALNICAMDEYWIIDSGAIDHMTNKLQNLHDFEKFSLPSKVSIKVA